MEIPFELEICIEIVLSVWTNELQGHETVPQFGDRTRVHGGHHRNSKDQIQEHMLRFPQRNNELQLERQQRR